MIKNCIYRLLVVGVLLVQTVLSGCRAAQPIVTPDQPTAPVVSPSETATEIPIPTITLGETVEETTTPTPAPTPRLPALPFDQFVDQAFAQLMQRDPEWATAEGVADQVGADEGLLTDLSIEGIRQTHALQKSLLEQLRAYPRLLLGPDQQKTYDAFEWYLDDLVRGQEFSEYDFPINQLQVLSVNYLTEYLFTDQHTIADEEDARLYLRRLAQVGPKMDDVLAGLERREQSGVIPPRRIIEASLGDIQIMANSAPRQTLYYLALYQHLAPLSSISPDVQDALLQEAEREIEASVLPAYQRLAEFLEGQRKRAPLEVGLWQYPRGEAYYRYLLRHHTTTDLTPAQVHQLGLDELSRLQAEMRQHFDRLGYPQSASINDLYIRVANEGGTVASDRVLTIYEEMIAQAKDRLDDAFNLQPAAELEVRGMPDGIAFYTAAPLDGSRPGIFYAPVGSDQLRFAMPTLAYHEAVPGHHFQISLAREQGMPLFRNLVVFGAYAEGWAMYSEHLAGELGWYAEDPYGDLGRLQSEAFRAARLVVDTGLHTQRWTFDQAVDFLVENTGLPYQQMAWEVTRYIAWPGQATSYEVGLLKMLELRQRAEQRLGDRFDLKDFHSLVLQSGSLPLQVLEQVVDDYLVQASSGLALYLYTSPLSGRND